MKIVKKYYSKSKKAFFIDRENSDGRVFTTEYTSFQSFYFSARKNLSDADLLQYDFDNIDLSRYNFENAQIPKSIRDKIKKHNFNIYNTLIEDVSYDKSVCVKGQLPVNRSVIAHNKLEYTPKNLCVCYISDLHLDAKIAKKYPNEINMNEIRDFLAKKIDGLKKSIPTFDNVLWNTYNDPSNRINVVIVGDVSCNFEIFKSFFYIYREKISNPTFFVLGNHELWDKTLIRKCKTLSAIIEKYREFLSSQKIVLLENQLFLPCEEKHLLGEKEIMSMSTPELNALISRNIYAIFGGIGYSGLNESMNYSSGIYRSAPLNRTVEKELSRKVALLHEKISDAASNEPIIWATHMPKEDWTNDRFNSNWIYLSGHTHRNVFIDSDIERLYADNQIGYKSQSIGFKQFWISPFDNMFENKDDGIYEITPTIYKYFYKALGKSISFNRDFSKLYMVKKTGNYCFLMTTVKSEELKLLAGGQIRNTGHKNIQYFYDNLDNYTQSVKKYMFKYEEYQNKIAQEVVGLGGIGTIHGCIIDIDFFNHLFVNPLDGKITPYYEDDMVNKYVYANVPSLLFAQNRGLYNKLMSSTVEDKMNYLIKHDEIISNENIKVTDTAIYRISRVISDLQYTTRDRVVRVWYKGILDKPTEENGREIVSQLISLGEAESTK